MNSKQRSSTTGSHSICTRQATLGALPFGVAVAWALAGHGIVARSEWDVAEHVKRRALVPLLPGWSLPEANVVALVKSRQDLPARTAGFLAHLREAFAATPWRDKGQA